MIKFFGILFLFISNSVFAQSALEVKVMANNQQIVLGTPFTIAGKTFQLELVKFYITNLRFFHNGVLVSDYTDQPQLVNLEDDSTTHILLSALPLFDEVRFTFGVDSSTNVNGIMSGALDPVNGMYWSWQSGYINCKIEGEIISSGRKSVAYHLGGYLPDQLAAKEISLPVPYSQNMELSLNLDSILSGLAGQNLFQIMSPGENAVHASDLLVESLQITAK
jgi:hypothetical protein